MKYKYDEVYVVIKYGDTDLYDVYTERDEAVLVADEQNESMKKLLFYDLFYDSKTNRYEVKTLWEAIDWIKEAIDDQKTMDEYYI